MNNIEITITGDDNQGKTGLIFILKEFLREKGFELAIQRHPEYNSEEQLNSIIGRNTVEEVAGYIKLKSKITLSEK